MCVAGGRLRPLGFKAGASAIFEDFWKISARFLGNFWVIPWAFSGPFWHQISSRKLIEKSSIFDLPGAHWRPVEASRGGALRPSLKDFREISRSFLGDFREILGRLSGTILVLKDFRTCKKNSDPIEARLQRDFSGRAYSPDAPQGGALLACYRIITTAGMQGCRDVGMQGCCTALHKI